MHSGSLFPGAAAAAFKKNVGGLTVPQVKLLLSVVLPRREFDADWVLEVIDYRRRRNHAAYLSHRKRRLEKLNQLE